MPPLSLYYVQTLLFDILPGSIHSSCYFMLLIHVIFLSVGPTPDNIHTRPGTNPTENKHGTNDAILELPQFS